MIVIDLQSTIGRFHDNSRAYNALLGFRLKLSLLENEINCKLIAESLEHFAGTSG